MTYIRPSKNSLLLNGLLAICSVLFAVGAWWLVVLYNSVVNLNHGFAQMKSEYQIVQAQTAEFKERFFNLASPEKLKSLASEKQLIQDKKPSYLEIRTPGTSNTKWSYASHF